MSLQGLSSWFPAVRSFVPVLLMSVCTTGCKKVPVVVVPTPGTLTLVQGNNQQVQGGLELPVPVVVRILGTDGKPLDKFPIGFAVAQGGGTVTPGSALSDENGEVKVKWTVGPNEIVQLLRASVPSLEPLAVNAIALLPSDLVIAQGNNQSARVGSAIPNAIVIRVVGPGNVPMKAIPVAFQVMTGGGLITPQSALTNALGEVTVRWTLGAAAGTNTLAVSSGSLQPIQLLAIGTTP